MRKAKVGRVPGRRRDTVCVSLPATGETGHDSAARGSAFDFDGPSRVWRPDAYLCLFPQPRQGSQGAEPRNRWTTRSQRNRFPTLRLQHGLYIEGSADATGSGCFEAPDVAPARLGGFVQQVHPASDLESGIPHGRLHSKKEEPGLEATEMSRRRLDRTDRSGRVLRGGPPKLSPEITPCETARLQPPMSSGGTETRDRFSRTAVQGPAPLWNRVRGL